MAIYNNENYWTDKFVNFFSLRKSYFNLTRKRSILWNTLGRYLVAKKTRWLFEGNRKLPGQLWLADREVIYNAVKTYRPAHVYEVGTWKGGGSTYFIAQALYENGSGMLHTVEIDDSYFSEAKANYVRHAPQLLPFIDFNLGTSTEIFPSIAQGYHAGVVFLDGLDGEQTFRDFQIFEPHLEGGEILIAHDWNDEKTSRLRPYLEANPRWTPVTIIDSPDSVGIAMYRYEPRFEVDPETADGMIPIRE